MVSNFIHLRRSISILFIFGFSTASSLPELSENEQTNRSLRGYVVNQHKIEIPRVLTNLGDFASPLKNHDLPVYWHVLKSGGTTMKHIFCQCFNFVAATENGLADGQDSDKDLNIIWKEGMSYVNVDTSTPHGIAKAKSLHLAQSGKVNVIITPLVHEIADIFDTQYQGRMFTMIRHPIDRVVSMFYYLQTATWESTFDPTLSKMTIEEYAKSGRVEENWMTRFLVNKKSDPLGPDDVILAREILRRKFLIGLLSRPVESMKRFQDYFGWTINTPEQTQCVGNLLRDGVNKHEHPPIERGGEAWNQLLKNNKYDLELYMYSVQLFEEQNISMELNEAMDF